MSGSVVALLMGLVLLGAAVWLLRRANSSSSSSSDASSDQAWGSADSWSGEGPEGRAGERAAWGDAGADAPADDVWGVKDGASEDSAGDDSVEDDLAGRRVSDAPEQSVDAQSVPASEWSAGSNESVEHSDPTATNTSTGSASRATGLAGAAGATGAAVAGAGGAAAHGVTPNEAHGEQSASEQQEPAQLSSPEATSNKEAGSAPTGSKASTSAPTNSEPAGSTGAASTAEASTGAASTAGARTADTSSSATDEPAAEDSSSTDYDSSVTASADTNEAIEAEEAAAGSTASRPNEQPNARMGKGFASVRKRRRTWAQSHGFEYLREDKRLVASWPWFMVGDDADGAIPTATDVVSGFAEGHKTHIADVNGRTLMAMRRDGFSLVDVHYTEGEAMPEGMRRSEPLDQPPYVAYTTDVRALDRMLDLRVEDALASLSQVASDVAWSGDWVVLRISRKLDTSVWDEILPHVRSLVDAAMVLPPEHVNIPLEMDHADQTRALPGGAMSVDAGANLAGGGAGAAGAEAESADGDSEQGAVRGHLRAMPDAQATSKSDELAGPGADESGAAGEGKEAGQEQDAAYESAYSNTVGPDDTSYLDEDRPEITRPAEPVVFPSRSESLIGGDSEHISGGGAHEAQHEDFRGADIFDDDDDDDTDHINGRLPRLGEDPAHTSQSTAGYSQVIRSDADHEATIFFDYEDDVEDGDELDFTDSNHVLRAASEPVVDADFADLEGPEASGDGQVIDAQFADVQGDLAGEHAGEAGVPAGAAADDATGDSELTNVSKMRRDRRRARRAAGGGGRHRAPDARHARPEPIEAVEVEIETVDAEIVEDED